MKIAIIGFSGAGKSTLARRLGGHLQLPVLHLDSIHFSQGWHERPWKDMEADIETFMQTHSSWIIEGNYRRACQEERLQAADKIIFMKFNAVTCLYRVVKRYIKYRQTSRPDMAAGCPEKLDWAFLKWILVIGRSKQVLKHYQNLYQRYPDKMTIIHNRRELSAFLKTLTS